MNDNHSLGKSRCTNARNDREDSMKKTTGKIMAVCLGCLPILFLLMTYNQWLESFTALGVCNLLAVIAAGIGSTGDILQKNERKTMFLFGSYYSLSAICFLTMFIIMALQEHIHNLIIFVFMLATFIVAALNVKGVLKYCK